MTALNAQLIRDSRSCDVFVYVRRQANREVELKVVGFIDWREPSTYSLPQMLLDNFGETFEWLLKDARSSFEISYKNLFATREYLMETN